MKTFRLIIAVIMFAPVMACTAQPSNKQAAASDSNSDKIEAYYFHFTARCTTCKTIEANAKENLETFNLLTLKKQSTNLWQINSVFQGRPCLL